MDGAYEACSGVVLASHPPQFLALGEAHFLSAMTTGNGAFDLELSGHFPNITIAAQGGACTAGRVANLTRFCQQGHSAQPHDRRARNAGPGSDPSGRHGWKQPCLQPPAGNAPIL